MKHGTIWPILILNKVKNLVLGKYFKKLSNVTMIIGKFGTTLWLLAPTAPTLKKSYELTIGTKIRSESKLHNTYFFKYHICYLIYFDLISFDEYFWIRKIQLAAF